MALERYRIFFAAVPKIACTSIKGALHELEYGSAFEPYYAGGRMRHIHARYPTLPRSDWPDADIDGYDKIAVVRDPIRRFLSAYVNRVHWHKELSRDACGAELDRLELAPTPSVELFIDRYQDYCAAHPSVYHHTRPICDYLGTDPLIFSGLYSVADLSRLEADLSKRAGRSVTLRHEQKSGRRIAPEDLPQKLRNKLTALYAEDYACYGKYFRNTRV